MMMLNCLQSFNKNPTILGSNSSPFLVSSNTKAFSETKQVKYGERGIGLRSKRGKLVIANGVLLPVDPWSPTIDSQSIASQLFAFSLFPYIGFLYFISKSKSAPKLTLFGFYFLLAFVGATSLVLVWRWFGVCCFMNLQALIGFILVPAGIYAKVQYGTSLSNVDWLHGGAESLLTLTNLFIVLGLRGAIRRAEDTKESTSNLASGVKEADKSST